MRWLLLTFVTALVISGGAHAAVVSYVLSGYFLDGRVVTGGFDVDLSGKKYTQFSNITLSVGSDAVTKLVLAVATGAPGYIDLVFEIPTMSNLQVGLKADYDAALDIRYIYPGPYEGVIFSPYYPYPQEGTGNSYITIVPEPASIALLGTTIGVCAAFRRRFHG